MLKQYYGKTNMCFGEGEAENYHSNYFAPGSASKVLKVKKITMVGYPVTCLSQVGWVTSLEPAV